MQEVVYGSMFCSEGKGPKSSPAGCLWNEFFRKGTLLRKGHQLAVEGGFLLEQKGFAIDGFDWHCSIFQRPASWFCIALHCCLALLVDCVNSLPSTWETASVH